MAHISRTAQLLAKKMRGTLSAQEQEELETLLRDDPGLQTFMDTRLRPDRFARGQQSLWELDEISLDEKMQQAILNSPYSAYLTRREQRRTSTLRWIISAVAIAAAAVIGIFIKLTNTSGETNQYYVNHTKKAADFCKDTSTVGSPRFTINGGPPILLDTVRLGSTFPYGNLLITKAGGHHLDIRWADSIDPRKQTSANSTLSLPAIKEYWQLSLPDSSRANLSPGTSTWFLIEATGNTIKKRVLALNGRAFFEIHPNPDVPLYIETLRGEIAVLGTEFDLRDYAKERTLTLSLFKGQVTISNGKKPKPLAPFHQATIESGKDIAIATNDSLPERVIWDEGVFDFRHKSLAEAMVEIIRYYKMDTVIFYKGVDTATKGTVLDGLPEKSLTVDELLSILNRKSLHFDRKGQKIVVSIPPK